jgi:hypothetical protein
MNRVITRPSPAPVRSLRSIALGVAGVVAALAFAFAVTVALRSPSTVDEVTIDNTTSYPVHVEVRDAGDGSWLGLGVVTAGGSQDFREVLDQGDDWVFRFTSGNARGGEIVVSRDDLADNDWTASVPADVGQRLEEDGAASAGS